MSLPAVMKSPLAKQISKSMGVDLHRASESLLNLTGQSAYREFPLIDPHPDAPIPTDMPYDIVETKIGKLANGVTVVTRNTQEPVGVVGVFLDAGSRYGTSQSSGIPHFLESIALEATDHRTALNLSSGLQNAGANLAVHASRDGLIYRCELFAKDADLGLGMIKEIIREPALEYWQFKEYQKEYLWRYGDDMGSPEMQMSELIHQAAWAGNTLGLSLRGDEFTVQNYKPEVMREFFDTFVSPTRVIVGAVGVPHNEVMELADAYWGDLQEGPPLPSIQAQWKGETIKRVMKLDDDLAHVALVFETENSYSDGLMAMCVLNMMMGGGEHFSSWGLGKGLHNRLNVEALGVYEWLNSIHSSHSVYVDSGIFAYYGTCVPKHSNDLLRIMMEQANKAATRVPSFEELERAKSSVFSCLCYDFEDRRVVFEDICRQTKVYGTHRTPEMWMDMIAKVTTSDVQRVAQKMLVSKPAVVVIGPTDLSDIDITNLL